MKHVRCVSVEGKSTHLVEAGLPLLHLILLQLEECVRAEGKSAYLVEAGLPLLHLELLQLEECVSVEGSTLTLWKPEAGLPPKSPI